MIITKLANKLFLSVLIGFALPVCSQAPGQSPVAPAKAETVPSNPPSADTAKINELTQRIQKLELELIQKSERPRDDNRLTVITAVIAASAVLGAALLGIVGQYFTAKREERRTALAAQAAGKVAKEDAAFRHTEAVAAAERVAELAREEAVFKRTERMLEFRLKQMEEFYAPIFALLGQSDGLYIKMLYQLAQDEPDRYKLPTETDHRGNRLYVRAKDGTWQGFRLLDQLPAVKRNPKAFALAEGILGIGERMTTIISERAGLASEDLIDLLGKYMAHYAILSTIYRLGETEPYEPGWHKMGYYPRELDGRIKDGYRELSQSIAAYAAASKHALETLPDVKENPRP